MRWTRLVSYLHMLGRLNGRNSLAAKDCSMRGKIKVNFKNLAVGTCARKPWNFRPNAVHAIGLSDDSVPASSRAKRAKILCDRGCGEKKHPCTEPAWRFLSGDAGHLERDFDKSRPLHFIKRTTFTPR
jgi:hypothetical protein